jgi:hypothetical protein
MVSPFLEESSIGRNWGQENMNKGQELAVYETHEEIFGRRSSLEELINEIRQFSLPSVLWVCAIVVVGTQLWDRSDPPLDVYATLLRLFFAPALANRFQIGFWSRNPRREVFHRRQILLIAKLAILHCENHGIDLRSSAERFGSILLKANDQFHHGLLPRPEDQISDEEKFARSIAEFVSVTEFGKPNIGHQLGRNQLLLTRYVEGLREDPDYADVSKEFEESSGFSLEENTAMLFGLHSRSGRNLAETVKADPGALPFSIQSFQQTPIPVPKILKFLGTISTTPAKIRREISRRDYGANDFTAFRKFPAVEQWYNPHLKSFWIGYLLMDHNMLLEKQLAGPYWHAVRLHGQGFIRFWGKVFEKYVNDLLTHSSSGTRAGYFPDVRDPRDLSRQVCDGIMVEEDLLTIIEAKGSVFTADAKYSGNYQILADEIKSKLVVDKDTGNKHAAIQLAHAAKVLTENPEILAQYGVDASKIRAIYPLVVTLDGIGSTIGMSSYLNCFFQEELAALRIDDRRVQPLGCVDIEAMEFMAEHLHSESLPKLLRRWHEFNPPLFMPFVMTPLDSVTWHENPWLKRASDERFKSTVRILFPDKDPEAALREIASLARREFSKFR